MFLSGSKLHFFFCLYASIYSCCSKGALILPKDVSVSAVIAFGDSFFDQGNNNYINTLGKANFPPYGKDFMGGKPTGRFSNGKTLPDLFAKALGVKDYLPASLDPSINDKDLQTGVSFASGGSGFDPFTTTITTGIPISDQLDMFKQYIAKLRKNIGEKVADEIINNSVVVVVAGTNDLILSLPIRSQYDVPSYINMLVKLILNFVQELQTLGVRRIAVFNAPPVGCLPALRTVAGGLDRSCNDKENNEAQLLNNILKQHLQFSASTFPETRIAYVDFYNPLIKIIDNPKNYGFEVADRGCCGTGNIEVIFLCNKLTPTCSNDSKFLFWDSFHLSEKGYEILLNHILQDLVNKLF